MLKFATATLLVACFAPSALGNDGPLDISPDGLNQGWEPGDYGIETCGLQKEIVDFSVERLSDGECGGPCQAYKICLTLNLAKSSIISKFPGKTSLTKVCVKDTMLCTARSFTYYLNKLWAKDYVGLAKGGDLQKNADYPTTSGSTQCQTVPAGQYAEFELSDGICLPVNSTWADEAYVGLSVSNEPISLLAECHSRPGWYQRLLAQGVNPADLGSCDCPECTLPKDQCIWRIQAPPCCDCPPAEGECKNELDVLHAGKYKFEVDLQNCTSPEDVAAFVNKQGSYGCAASTILGCRTIKCEQFVPPELYQSYLPCSLEKH